jgi:hypothetical protein
MRVSSFEECEVNELLCECLDEGNYIYTSSTFGICTCNTEKTTNVRIIVVYYTCGWFNVEFEVMTENIFCLKNLPHTDADNILRSVHTSDFAAISSTIFFF